MGLSVPKLCLFNSSLLTQKSPNPLTASIGQRILPFHFFFFFKRFKWRKKITFPFWITKFKERTGQPLYSQWRLEKPVCKVHKRMKPTCWGKTEERGRLHLILHACSIAGKNTGEGCHFLLQGILPTQGLNPGLLHLLHWQVGSLSLSHLGSPSLDINIAEISDICVLPSSQLS